MILILEKEAQTSRVGDELMCLFETGDAALNAARIMQEWVTRQEELGQSTIAVRVGSPSNIAGTLI